MSRRPRAEPNRYQRFFHGRESAGLGKRSESERDSDRLLYCSPLRRLAGVTQVASPTVGDVFHNRLTHTLQVARLGRRISKQIILGHLDCDIDPDVVEAAGLAHDLGHAPFGHVGEETLKSCLADRHEPNGFEGNAQSFRVITKLAFSRPYYSGLNLTRATLNATLKYPWLRTATGKKSKKFGAYDSEEKEFNFARELSATIEAEIMDWADDITYAVHDIEDFYQAGFIPLGRLAISKEERNRFLNNTEQRWKEQKRDEAKDFSAYSDAFENLMDLFPFDRPYAASPAARDYLKPVTSTLIDGYLKATSLDTSKGQLHLHIKEEALREVTILKELTWNYVILSPALATQQHGYKRIVRGLFDIFADAIAHREMEIIPSWFRVDLSEGRRPDENEARVAADIVTSLTDQQALTYFRRLTGVEPGSLTVVS